MAALAQARAAHPELRRPLTWNGAVAICRRLGIPLVYAPMVRPARCLALLGTPVLMLDSNTPPRRHTYFVAHELAHVFLHVDPSEGAVFNMEPCDPDDPREEEAEVLATLMLGGPRFTRHF